MMTGPARAVGFGPPQYKPYGTVHRNDFIISFTAFCSQWAIIIASTGPTERDTEDGQVCVFK
jgi:hypothetical protein